MANNSGVYPLPKEIQNTQTTSSNYDQSHIICGEIQSESWTADQIHVKGNLVFEPPYTLPPNYYILAQDSSSSITADNGSIISSSGQWTDMNIYENAIFYSGQTSLQWFDQQLLLNTPYLSINQQPSSQFFICYGQAKGEGNTQEQYHILFPDADTAQPDFNLRMFGFPDIQTWFDNDSFNPPDNNFIQKDGDCFRLVQQPNYMVEITITWQLRYTFDGANPSIYLCCGLFNRDFGEIVPQSLQWYTPNDIKHKYMSFKTTFIMRCDGGSSAFFPFFQQQNDGGGLQVTNTEIQGKCRSSIQFKFYQFIQY